ncbi:uncharacterized protein B0P05DRAFT_569975 [Gilbertella persicaria]|uniref:uncharacterized protein n=1 Tax=Gilbertella persicaria TaxID=101096 RepID=UPI00221F21E0|nr:uncharacterized protein B0P05DRAFT_569975 [Gilbertella persicaria]KAI8085759.1 hypothetical protein B0P05DRAFT_569975 [Gilbertella persicaria]
MTLTQVDANSSEEATDSQFESTRRVKRRLLSNELDDRVGFKRSRSSTQPRWHNQSYMLFLALRQHPEKSLPRRELIQAALALDKKISAELSLPKVFRGRTPGNSASAILTYNNDRYFVPFKPEGSRSMHFRLAYEPGDVNHAVAEYQKWCKKLAEHDWPYCFGVPKPDAITSIENNPKEVDQKENQKKDQPVEQQTNKTEETDHAALDDKENAVKDQTPSFTKQAIETKALRNVDLNSRPKEEVPQYTLDQLDLSDIPTNWRDVVYIAPSCIPGAGNGLFAKRKIPFNVPIGFYFGVPMTEDEFDSLKDRVGRSSEYSIMYRKTVLDATDDQGEPVTDESSPRFCPFHFMNETDWKHATVAFVEGVVVNQVICWTRKEIQADEELLVWYGADVDRHWDGKSIMDTAVEQQVPM